MEAKYKDDFNAAMEYQDFLQDELMKRGMVLGCYGSKKYQFERGESASGIEVKLDRNFSRTGNLYIEIAELSRSEGRFIPAGIYREDESWLYLIGDYSEAFLFGKKHLQINREKRNYREVETNDSRGYLYPIEDALRGMCLRHFRFDEDASR